MNDAYARIYITKLADAKASALVMEISKLTKGSGAVIKIDHPDPPDLFGKEFNDINNQLLNIETAAVSNEDFYGEAPTPTKVKKELTRLRRHIEKLNSMVGKLADMEATLSTKAELLNGKKR